MSAVEVAQAMLSMAHHDANALRVLAAASGVAPSILGFHAQQAVEKALKSVLLAHSVVFRRTHDLVMLLDLIADEAIEAPPYADTIDDLNPYAVAARYGLESTNEFDARIEMARVEAVLAWADRQLRHAR